MENKSILQIVVIIMLIIGVLALAFFRGYLDNVLTLGLGLLLWSLLAAFLKNIGVNL